MNLRDQFDRAVGDEPDLDPGAMAHTAIAAGGRMRRRRRQGVAAALVLLVVAGGLTGFLRRDDPPRVTVAAAMFPAAPACSVKPVPSDATDLAIFLSYRATAGQKAALGHALGADRRVAEWSFESRATAYQRFKELWADSPDFVASVQPENLPESYRVRLTDPAQFTSVEADYGHRSGVDTIVGRICPISAPVGGVK